MQKEKDNFKVYKNIRDLEYRKLLNEYNAWLIALISVSLGVLGFVYSVTTDIFSSFLLSILSVIAINIKREEKSEELKEKINEIKDLE